MDGRAGTRTLDWLGRCRRMAKEGSNRKPAQSRFGWPLGLQFLETPSVAQHLADRAETEDGERSARFTSRLCVERTMFLTVLHRLFMSGSDRSGRSLARLTYCGHRQTRSASPLSSG